MTTEPIAGTLPLDAEALYAALKRDVEARLREGGGTDRALLGIWSGGAWLVERLAADLELPASRVGVISSALHRDDYGRRGMAGGGDATRIPFAVGGTHIVLVDDVLATGRTIRAVVNELFDFGRPASVTLSVLVDRGGRQLPIDAAFAAARIAWPESQRLTLSRDDAGRLSFAVRAPRAPSEAA